MTDDQLLRVLVLRYHQAHASHDVDTLRACLAQTYNRWH